MMSRVTAPPPPPPPPPIKRMWLGGYTTHPGRPLQQSQYFCTPPPTTIAVAWMLVSILEGMTVLLLVPYPPQCQHLAHHHPHSHHHILSPTTTKIRTIPTSTRLWSLLGGFSDRAQYSVYQSLQIPKRSPLPMSYWGGYPLTTPTYTYPHSCNPSTRPHYEFHPTACQILKLQLQKAWPRRLP